MAENKNTINFRPEYSEYERFFRAGENAFQQTRYAEAIELFSDIIKNKPETVSAYIARGNCYKALKQWENMANDYMFAIQLRKKVKLPAYLYEELANYFRIANDDKQAKKFMIKAYFYKKDYSKVLSLCEEELRQIKERELKQGTEEELKQIKKDKNTIYWLIADTHCKVEKFSEAIQLYKKLIITYLETKNPTIKEFKKVERLHTKIHEIYIAISQDKRASNNQIALAEKYMALNEMQRAMHKSQLNKLIYQQVAANHLLCSQSVSDQDEEEEIENCFLHNIF